MKKKKINIKINNKQITAYEGQSILEAAYFAKIEIPHLCYHPDTCVKANCRLCVVEVEGMNRLPTACSTKVKEGMEIKTHSQRVLSSRKTNLELLFAEHTNKCATCEMRYNCQLLNYAQEYKIKLNTFQERKKNKKKQYFANAIELDNSQCIDCRNCVDICALQEVHYLEVKNRGYKIKIAPKKDKKFECVYCGQCTVHCPVAALQERSEYDKVEKILNNKQDKIVIAQIAPSIRASIGEIFNMPYGKIVTDQLIASLKKLGFDYVFDVNFGADITTIVEANELVERLKKKKVLPMFSSCCPAWVRFVEVYYPEFIPNLTSARSPHIHSGGAVKTYWAGKMELNPKKIVLVSIMPCTAKKFEASREELRVNDLKLVDYVLTTRELGFLLKKNQIDLSKIKAQKVLDPLGVFSGAGAIYGASGGVMESALRTVSHLLGKEKIDFKKARGQEGVKEFKVKIGKKILNTAVVNGLGNAKKILEEIKRGLKKYDYIEFMACPGGCIGGGGQPIPTTPLQRKKRAESLYLIDKKKKIRKAHENEEVLKYLEWLKGQEIEHNLLHTYFKS